MINKTIFERRCPKCNKHLTYTTKYRMKNQEKVKGLCYKCRRLESPIKHTEESKKRLSELTTERFSSMSKAEKIKLSEMGKFYSNRRKPLTEEKRLLLCGKGNNFYGKTHSDDFKIKMSKRLKGKPLSLEHKMKISNSCKGKINIGNSNGMKRAENQKKVRLTTLKNLKEKYNNIIPSFNIDACKYFDKLNEENGWQLQHAKNGGEHYITELGYWLDAYDKEKNIVVEYDEPKHYTILGKLKEKDVKRQNEIIMCLNCRFYRYDEKRNRFYSSL